MRFYYQSADMGSGQKVATKCIRVASTATTRQIIETLIEKFRPDMKMLEVPEYALYEIHESGERKLGPEEKPLLVQLNWHKDDREGRFLLRRMDEPTNASQMPAKNEDPTFKRKLSKREKKELKKAEKAAAKQAEKMEKEQDGVAEKLYTGKTNYHATSLILSGFDHPKMSETFNGDFVQCTLFEKLFKNFAFEFSTLAFSTSFYHIKTYQSGSTI